MEGGGDIPIIYSRIPNGAHGFIKSSVSGMVWKEIWTYCEMCISNPFASRKHPSQLDNRLFDLSRPDQSGLLLITSVLSISSGRRRMKKEGNVPPEKCSTPIVWPSHESQWPTTKFRDSESTEREKKNCMIRIYDRIINRCGWNDPGEISDKA
ncbi:hypothetical protein HNY73_001678 [Argiope bruennichi]|uniref:Uncharacterized protein n=1 Tax=Argiope bruennichi TaxID=94029 RepID=A0A8T0FS36_ARGBR|nr:hypothetical protein HNY73_001678 [Argiope bruennichi]